MPEKIFTMKLLKEKLGLCRLNRDELIPDWAKNWRALKIERQLEFSLIGILSSISTILTQKGISIFAVSTFDTDYVLVKERDIANAIRALSNEVCQIIY